MQVAILALTEGGKRVALDLAAGFGSGATVFLKEGLTGPCPPDAVVFSAPLRRVVAEIFGRYDGLIFIMALGIAVRMIAPHLADKREDPAVVVVDELGQSAISVLSGHVGGANDLAREVAGILGARAVITTATDIHGLPAADLLASRLGARLEPWSAVKTVNAAIVNGKKVGLFSDYPVRIGPDRIGSGGGRPETGAVPLKEGWRTYPLSEFKDSGPWDAAVLITNRVLTGIQMPHVMLRPPSLIVGVGCRRGIMPDRLLRALEKVLAWANLSLLSVGTIASISLKADETGITDMARLLGARVRFFSRDAIEETFTEHPDLSRSNVVRDRIGVDGVCEPVLLLAGARKILVPKTVLSGITLAIGEAVWPSSASVPAIGSR